MLVPSSESELTSEEEEPHADHDSQFFSSDDEPSSDKLKPKEEPLVLPPIVGAEPLEEVKIPDYKSLMLLTLSE
jgi:hypothetical protein